MHISRPNRARLEGLFLLVFCIAIPLALHITFRGSHLDTGGGEHRTYWIDPIGTTLPFVGLAALVMRRTRTLADRSPLPTYLGGALGWLAMMGFSLYLASLPAGPDSSSTMGVAIIFTPLFYLPYLLLPYGLDLLIDSTTRGKASDNAGDRNSGT